MPDPKNVQRLWLGHQMLSVLWAPSAILVAFVNATPISPVQAVEEFLGTRH